MQCLSLFALFAIATVRTQDVSDEVTTTETHLAEGEKKMSENILAIMEHFKDPDPIGLPVVEIPEPYPVPDTKQSVAMGATVHFMKTNVYGLRKLRILYVNAEIGAMEVIAGMKIDKLQARGDYTMSTFFNRASGPFAIDITGLLIIAKASVGVERDGKIRAQTIHLDLSTSGISVDFQNLGFLGGMLQGVINTMGPVMFDSIKPYILKEVYTKARIEINSELEKVAGDMQFPNSISPLDMVIADVRKMVRNKKWDPYQIQDYNATVSIFTVALENTWIMGISSFQRVGNITLKMENNTMIADFEIGTQKLEGMTQWDISAINGLASKAGTASFSLEYMNARIVLAQPLDTRKKPEFRNLDLEIGNIQVRCDGAGTIDYVIEFAVNVLPNLLRYQIMDAIEGPVKEKVQLELDKFDVEELIMQTLPEIDQLQEKGLKLSSFIDTNNEEEKQFDEDEFFNF